MSKETEGSIVDFSQVRTQKLDEKRRKTERIFFEQILGVYSVISQDKMRPIEIVEVSEDGLSFRSAFDAQNPWPSQEGDFPIRLYFSQSTYLEVRVKIVNSRSAIDDRGRYIRYGCQVDPTLGSYEAFKQFVAFLKAYAEHSHSDRGSRTAFYG